MHPPKELERIILCHVLEKDDPNPEEEALVGEHLEDIEEEKEEPLQAQSFSSTLSEHENDESYEGGKQMNNGQIKKECKGYMRKWKEKQ